MGGRRSAGEEEVVRRERNTHVDDIHEIYAIKYGRHERKKAENYIGGDPHDADEPIDYFVWAIIGPSGNFVVDTGFDHAMAQEARARRSRSRSPKG